MAMAWFFVERQFFYACNMPTHVHSLSISFCSLHLWPYTVSTKKSRVSL